MLNFFMITGFENVVSTVELDRSSLAYTDTRHQTRLSQQSHITTFVLFYMYSY